MMTFYKRQSGSHGSRGNCIAFEQEVGSFAEELIQLPRPPEELPIVILTSPGQDCEHNFKVSRKNILAALQLLIKHNPYYQKYVNINLDNLNKYPETVNATIQGLRTVELEENNPTNDGEKLLHRLQKENQSKTTGKTDFHNMDEIFDQDADLIQEAAESNEDGLPKHQGTRPLGAKKGLIDDKIKEVADNIRVAIPAEIPQDTNAPQELPRVKCPQRGTEAVSEFDKGYLTRAFPHLFYDLECKTWKNTKVA